MRWQAYRKCGYLLIPAQFPCLARAAAHDGSPESSWHGHGRPDSNGRVPALPDLNQLSHAEKDALILLLWDQVQAVTARVAELEGKLAEPARTPGNSSVLPSKGQKPNRPETSQRGGPRKGSLGREGGGRPLACDPDETVTAKALVCAHCQAALTDA